ncbi:hypothetical protein [Rhizobium sp. MHM7A]|uniref:hypothetical protein n=1 Tax=Rhizobium sp. MHM7A TaxID=2583233 RepID=UPI001105F528|nr:hypothetical protein [Rhizobium sp. MHM7A]TLX16709.1 hypothetical protein FFR93_05035 [Rhizobium sp. MHM7A]
MTEMTKVAFYYGLNAKSHIIDHLVQPEPSLSWVPALLDTQQRNLYQLMGLANVSTEAWRDYLITKYGFDPAKPTAEGLLRAGVDQSRISFAMETAAELAEAWEDPESRLWSHDEDFPANLTPAQVEEVLAESRGRGTPVIVFQAPTEVVEKALAEDNQITLTGVNGIYVGLSDPINGYGWSPSHVNAVTFRPSAEGLVVLGEHAVFENCVDDAYTAGVAFEPGVPLRLSSRSEETSSLSPPPVRDEREAAPSMRM